MEGGEIIFAGGSLRKNGSNSLWRNDTVEIFSKHGEEEEDAADEEALKWAALERLPTYERLKKGILTTSKGLSNQLNVQDLGFLERSALVDRLVEDNGRFLSKLKNRIDNVGIEFPKIEVRFEHLNIETEAHVGSRALPTFLNFSVGIVEGFLNYVHFLPSRKKRLCIFEDISGIIRPTRLTLLLGPPSSGKTTLLKALAGKLDPNLKFSGRVTYNGHGMNEFVPQRTAAYISQHDTHIAQMTVRETLAFAARCQGVGNQYEMLAELLRREKELKIKPDPDLDFYMKAVATEGQESNVFTDYIIKILGLEVCADVLVGNEMLRGVSGGQRKRVTTGEMLVGPAKVLFMDEISTGLDSSTTFQIVNSIKQFIHHLNGTAIISLLQPTPETYDLFDDVILLSDGHLVYQGPREHVLEFFEHMGFKCPERKGIADFLQEVTSRKYQEQYWATKDEPFSFVTAKEFAKVFHLFHEGKRLEEELSIPFDKAKSHPAALTTRRYGLRKIELLKACFSRELLLIKRNSFVQIFKLTRVILIAITGMTIFLRTEMHHDSVADGRIFMGSLFYAVGSTMFNDMSDISMTIAKLPVFYKQRDLLFYPAWAFSLPQWITKIPFTLIQTALWEFLTYYIIGYDPNVRRFFAQYLVLALISQMCSALFQFIAAAGRNMIIVNIFGTFALIMLLALGGFVLSRNDIKSWWTWAFWISPLMYGQNAILVNEFLGNSWSKVLPNSTDPLGIQVLKSKGFFTQAYWYWIGVGALVGFMLLFNLCFTLALTFLDPLQKLQAVITEDSSDREIRSSPKFPSTPTEITIDNESQKKRRMVLPFEPHSITFNNIKYSVDMPEQMKNQGLTEDRLELLRGVSGAFRPGVLTALMGVSGAGKTTLMDVLAGRKAGGYIEGNITISGYPKKQETFSRISGYCEQNDIHSPHVTVYESLLYSAWLRLPPEVNNETRKRYVEEVMLLVELEPLRQALVGLPSVGGLSTEQRKRLTIAVELVANPSIIFMDEPTSGLDARAAAIVMTTVRKTVDTGRTIVCTIHQPSIDIFEAFDELFLMKRGGQEIFVGPLGHHSCHLIKYFEEIEGVPNIRDGYNPATWMLEITSSAQETVSGINFASVYKNSELFRRNKALIEELSKPAPGSKDLHFRTHYSQPFLIQCMACLWKQRCSYWQNPSYSAVRILSTTVIALIIGTIFWKIGSKMEKQQDIFNAMGSMFVPIIFMGLQNASTVQPIVAIERTVFYRERAAGMYSPLAYAFAQVLVELPYVFFQAVIYCIIVYAMIGFEWSAAKFFWYLFFMYFTLLYYTISGMMCVAATPNLQIASIITFALFAPWQLFSGFIIPQPRTPIWWRWFFWICPFAYTIYGLVSSQFGDIKHKLESGETVEEFLRSYYDFKHELVGAVGGAVVGIALFFAFIFTISTKLFNFQRR